MRSSPYEGLNYAGRSINKVPEIINFIFLDKSLLIWIMSKKSKIGRNPKSVNPQLFVLNINIDMYNDKIRQFNIL